MRFELATDKINAFRFGNSKPFFSPFSFLIPIKFRSVTTNMCAIRESRREKYMLF